MIMIIIIMRGGKCAAGHAQQENLEASARAQQRLI